MATELYQLKFPNGKSYIGISRCATRRYKGHANAASKGSDLLLSRAWRKYGRPKLTVLAVVEDHLRGETESKAVAVFKTFAPLGYNMTPGGEVAPTTVPEIAAKVSKAMTGKKKSLEHRANIAKGKSKQMLNYFKDPRARALQSVKLKAFCDANPEFGVALNRAGCEAIRGMPMTEEHKTRIGTANLGHMVSKAARMKISTALQGNVPANKGKKTGHGSLSDEVASARVRKQWADMTAEQRSARAEKTWMTRRQRGTDRWANG